MDKISKLLYELCGAMIENNREEMRDHARKSLIDFMENPEYIGSIYTGLRFSGMSAEDVDKRMDVLTKIVAEALDGLIDDKKEEDEYRIVDE